MAFTVTTASAVDGVDLAVALELYLEDFYGRKGEVGFIGFHTAAVSEASAVRARRLATVTYAATALYEVGSQTDRVQGLYQQALGDVPPLQAFLDTIKWISNLEIH